MASNALELNQASTVLNSIMKQATGETGLVASDLASFVTVGQMVLKTGYDNTLNAISQVLSKTIFSIRPYDAKFKGLVVDNQRFGNITRKLSIADREFEDDERQLTVEGQAIDQYTVKKPNILELNFYGSNVWQDHYTVYKDQLDRAFNSPSELLSLMSLIVSNMNDRMEQSRENLARGTVANFIAGKVTSVNGVINLITEYNAKTGLALTDITIYLPENYKDFMQWVNSRIETLAKQMSERTQKFHINVVGKEIKRHTPRNKMKMYLIADEKYGIESRVMADQFHDTYMKLADNETVTFWQAIETPDEIDTKTIYLHTDGTLITSPASVQVTNVLGVMFDEEAMGVTFVNQWMMPTPFNVAGGYTNFWMHETKRYWTDYTENGIVLLLA